MKRVYRVVVHDGREDGALEDTVNFFIAGVSSDERVELAHVAQVLAQDEMGWWTRTTLFFLVVTIP